MPRARKPKYVMYGICSQCGREIIRPADVDTAVCDCTNDPHEVSLSPVLLFYPSRILQKLQDLCPASVSLGKFVNSLLSAALEHLDKNPELLKVLKETKRRVNG